MKIKTYANFPDNPRQYNSFKNELRESSYEKSLSKHINDIHRKRARLANIIQPKKHLKSFSHAASLFFYNRYQKKQVSLSEEESFSSKEYHIYVSPFVPVPPRSARDSKIYIFQVAARSAIKFRRVSARNKGPPPRR